MQIIAISKGSQSYGEGFAQKLAANLGYLCISREEILEEATRRRIPIGRLETAIIKPHIFSEELALELEHYKALATSYLCEKALNHNIVYHGRTGHLLLPGIDHILKVRVIADVEARIDVVMQRLGLSRAKARHYIDQLEEDRRRWVRQFYGVDWDASSGYDLVINLSHMNVENAATAACAMAQLPEFQATPAITRCLQDLHLASSARLLLASDGRTNSMGVKVRAGDGIVYVTYLGHQAKDVQSIPEIVGQLDGVRETICTQAETNLLWIQEEFNPQDDGYGDVLHLAEMWDAAVELMQVSPDDEDEAPADEPKPEKEGIENRWEADILDDEEEAEPGVPEGMSKTYEKLIGDGRAGGKKVVRGSQRTLVRAVDRSIPYRLIILDHLFAGKDHAAQNRLQREWANYVSDSLKTPVVSLAELRSRYSFGWREVRRMASCGIVTALIVILIFRHDEAIFWFLSREEMGWRLLGTASLFVFIPLFAYIYSTVTGLFLKMLKME